jgi:hypothetical protein
MTSLSNLEEDIQKIRHAKATAERERSLPPVSPPYLARVPFIVAMVRERVQFDEETAKRGDKIDIFQTYVGNEKYFCATPLSNLRRNKKTLIVLPRY